MDKVDFSSASNGWATEGDTCADRASDVQLLIGDCRKLLRQLPDESMDCVVTSPPYYGLRDYGDNGQIGLEVTPADYVAQLVGVFDEVRRVLRRNGTLWLNLAIVMRGRARDAAPMEATKKAVNRQHRGEQLKGGCRKPAPPDASRKI